MGGRAGRAFAGAIGTTFTIIGISAVLLVAANYAASWR